MNDKALRVFFVAGEPSGDRIGADVMRRLTAIRPIEPMGVGGPEMTREGLNSIFPMSNLSVMGFTDVIARLPLLFWRLRQTVRHILRERPDIVVLIDSQVFSAQVATGLRLAGFPDPILLYVAPAVWAWKPERAPKLAPLFNEILSVLPFEPEVMVKLGGPKTSYVGHPAVNTITEISTEDEESKGLIALLPGSRRGEIKRHMNLFRQVTARVAKHDAVNGFVLPTLPHLENTLRKEVSGWDVPVHVISDQDERDAVLAHTRVAIVTAGTITLELALAGIPMAGTYIPDKRLMKHYLKAGRPMIGLPNIMLGRRVIPEIFPDEDMLETLYAATINLVENAVARAEQRDAFREMRKLMISGADGSPRQNPADRILAYVQDR